MGKVLTCATVCCASFNVITVESSPNSDCSYGQKSSSFASQVVLDWFHYGCHGTVIEFRHIALSLEAEPGPK